MIQSTDPQIYKVPENNVEFLKKNIDKLNRRCAKLGNGSIEINEVGESFICWVTRIADKKRCSIVLPESMELTEENILDQFKIQYPRESSVSTWDITIRRNVHFTVKGESPKLNGWRLLAVLEHIESGNIIRRIPGTGSENMPLEMRYTKPTCDHCQASRQRKDTYVVEHEDGRLFQVGKSCMKDFTGHTDPKKIAAIAENLYDIMNGIEEEDEESFFGGSGPRYYSVKDVLALAARIIRVDGTYKSAQFDSSTKSTVFKGLYTKDRYFDDAYGRQNQPEDIEKADKCIDWATNTLTTNTDFAWNLKLALSQQQCNSRQIGLIVAGMGSFINRPNNTDEKREAKESTQEVKKVSEYFGQEKVRYTRVLTVKKILSIENEFGNANIVIFIDAEGNSFKWTTSSYFVDKATNTNVGEGMTVDATFTVKGHKDYKEIKQTVIFRVVANKIIENQVA